MQLFHILSLCSNICRPKPDSTSKPKSKPKSDFVVSALIYGGSFLCVSGNYRLGAHICFLLISGNPNGLNQGCFLLHGEFMFTFVRSQEEIRLCQLYLHPPRNMASQLKFSHLQKGPQAYYPIPRTGMRIRSQGNLAFYFHVWFQLVITILFICLESSVTCIQAQPSITKYVSYHLSRTELQGSWGNFQTACPHMLLAIEVRQLRFGDVHNNCSTSNNNNNLILFGWHWLFHGISVKGRHLQIQM